MTTPVGDMDISGPPSTQQAQHLGVVRTKSGAAPSISPQLENTALGDMAHAIESLAPQLVGKGKNEQLDLLQKIHNKIFRMIVDVPSGRSTAPFEQDVQRICALKTLLTNTSRALAHHPEAARYLEHMAYAIDRLEARIEKNFGPNDATKRYTDLQAVAAVSVGLCGLGGSRDKVLLWEQKMQEALAEIETSYADRHELEQTMRLLTHTKRNIKGLTRQWMVLSIGRAEERIASHLQPMIRHIFEEASTSANPAAVLQHEFSTVEALYGADDSFLPFMRDARRLLVLFQTRSAEEARSFLIPLLRYTLCPTHPSPITSPIHGHQVAAQALFMLDQAADQFGGVVSSDFSKSVEALGRAAADLSSRGALQRWEELLSVYKEPYDSEGLKQIFLPAEMARQLVLADGSLNLGFVSIAKDSLLAGRTAEEKKDTSLRQHIATVLHHLQSDDETVGVLERIPPPACGTTGSRTVNAMLLREGSAQSTARDTHRVVLASLLTWQRQGSLGLCFVYSEQHQRADASLRWLVEDFAELLAGDGVLRRTVSGHESKFPGLSVSNPGISHRKISAASLRTAFSIPSIQHGCRTVGCTSKGEFDLAVRLAGKRSGMCSLEDVFAQLCQLHALDPNSIHQAIWAAESAQQPLLLTLWTNAMGGLFAHPVITPASTGTEVVNDLTAHLTAILEAFESLARDHGLDSIATELSRLRRPIYRAQLQTYDPTSPILQGTYLTAQDEPAKHGLYEALAPLAELRLFMVPTSDQGPKWILGRELGDVLQPLCGREDFGSFLKDKFLECCLRIAPDMNEPIAGAVLEIDKNTLIERFEKAYDNTLWEGQVRRATVEHPRLGGMFGYERDWNLERFQILERSSSAICTGAISSAAGVQSSQEHCNYVLNLAQRVRRQEGISPDITAIAHRAGHRFRFQPNNPSLIVDDTTRARESVESMMTTLISRRYDPESLGLHWELGDRYAEYREILEKSFPAQPSALGKTVRWLLGLPGVSQAKPTQEATLEDIIQQILKRFTANYEAEHKGKECPKTVLDWLRVQILIDRAGPAAKDLFFHFADTNYVMGGLPIHYSLYFDPIEREWKVAMTVGSPNRDHPIRVIDIDNEFLETFSVQTRLAPLAGEVRRKELLDIHRVVSKRLFQIEQAFTARWNRLSATSLSPSDRAELAEGLSEGLSEKKKQELAAYRERATTAHLLQQGKELVEQPLPTWPLGLLSQCFELRAIYQAIVQTYVKPREREEYRFSAPRMRDETTKYLFDDDAFSRATSTLLGSGERSETQRT